MNLNQLKELAQKKKGRDVPCDDLESALDVIDWLEGNITAYKRILDEDMDSIMRKMLEPSDQSNKVTRFEVITQEGRAYVNNKCSIELSYQDDGRTLKVFVK